MANKKNKPNQHSFRNKLLLNQWLISLFGVDTLSDRYIGQRTLKPFHDLSEALKKSREGLNHDNIHEFYYSLTNSNLFWNDKAILGKEHLLFYEQNIVRHTQAINEKRSRPVTWKYFQWLALLFTEIYLDRYFNGREALLYELNDFVTRFNRKWIKYADMPPYTEDDLNKLCLQNATGSGKTLLMHVNILQYRHYAKSAGKDKDISRTILITPNNRLSDQHIGELGESNISAAHFLNARGNLLTAGGLRHVDVIEITKLADEEGPNTIATRSLGDQNLLLVDEGHRGMSGKDEGAWFSRRASLCARGFTIEYSATFEQAVAASGRVEIEDSYAKNIIFDYSYRWFYEDGFGKDYQILNLPDPSNASIDKAKDRNRLTLENEKAVTKTLMQIYLTACLLKYYQQLRIYQDNLPGMRDFNIEKPLWVFVGNTVSNAKGKDDEKAVATDVAQVVQFIAGFLSDEKAYKEHMRLILTSFGNDTGMLDSDGNDIFAGEFKYLARILSNGETINDLYRDIMKRLFNNPAGGHLELIRIKGDSGEIALRAGTAEDPFGLITVGNAKGLSDHIEEIAAQDGMSLTVTESSFTEAIFSSVKDSISTVNLLIGSKKFIEGWDCWRVSTMGLMHVGKSEGAQIIQLFGRGVRLKGHGWSLKRSGHTYSASKPLYIEELDALNVFGIESHYMANFRKFLKDEGLPGNEHREAITIRLNVTYDFGKKLKILRPRTKASDGSEYDFKKDAPVPTLGDIPDYIIKNQVVADWYPRIQAMRSKGTASDAKKDNVELQEEHLALLNYDELYFELERFKRERSWYNLNISKSGIRQLLSNPTWYILYMPTARLAPDSFDGIMLLQQAVSELLKRYCERYYNYCNRKYIEPRLELRELTSDDGNIPRDKEYQIVADIDEAQVIQHIKEIINELKKNGEYFRKLNAPGQLAACKWDVHLYQPLFHVKSSDRITVQPVTLKESEYRFVEDLKLWCDSNMERLKEEGTELFLLRNLSRGKGAGFFEAANFHPDFILWML